MADVDLKKLGINFDYLNSLPRGGLGREWSAPWRIACQVLFVNGFNASAIEKMLKGPRAPTIYQWANEGDWLTERDKFIRETATKALEASQETAVDVNQRHIKALMVMQNAGMVAIAKNHVSAKSLEGTIQSVISAMRAERDILGLGGGTPNPTIINDNRVQSVVASFGDVPIDKLDEYFILQRQRLEIDNRINQIVGSESDTIIDGDTTKVEEQYDISQEPTSDEVEQQPEQG
jgi:hypothetical protein